jgi:hypothetical protein
VTFFSVQPPSSDHSVFARHACLDKKSSHVGIFFSLRKYLVAQAEACGYILPFSVLLMPANSLPDTNAFTQ